MKREFALVVETYDNNIAKVELQRGASCEGCSICSSGKPIVLRALNNINANKGDRVIIEVEELKRGTNFFSFIVPLICLIVGYVIGDYFSKSISIENLGPIFSFVVFFIYIIFGILKLKNNNKIIANIICQNKNENETTNDFDK